AEQKERFRTMIAQTIGSLVTDDTTRKLLATRGFDLTMRFAWLWFNRMSAYIGLAFMLAEVTAWTWSSVQAGHALNVRRFHQQFEERLFQVFDRDDTVKRRRAGE